MRLSFATSNGIWKLSILLARCRRKVANIEGSHREKRNGGRRIMETKKARGLEMRSDTESTSLIPRRQSANSKGSYVKRRNGSKTITDGEKAKGIEKRSSNSNESINSIPRHQTASIKGSSLEKSMDSKWITERQKVKGLARTSDKGSISLILTPSTDPERRHGPKHKDHGREGRPRYNDLAGHRVIIDFEHFVTAYTYDLDLFPNNSTLPRLDHLSTEELQPIREDITHMILTRDPSRHAFDWQSVVDMIMAEYSEELRRLARGHFPSVAALREELERKLEPFIDYNDIGDWESVTYRCQERFIPKHVANDTVVVRAVRDISREICSAMTSVLADSEIDMETAGGVFQQLVQYLAWPAERHGPR